MNHPSSPTALKPRLTDFFGIGFELISLMFLVRLVVDISNRIFLPFIPQLSSGLGLTITAFSWLLALRSLTGLASPAIGVLADRYGRRSIMVIALVVRGIGMLWLAFSSGWWSAFPMLLISLSTTAFLPVQRAYISDRVVYERTGRALAAIDASFSTAGMLGLPLVGWVIEVWGWQPPLLILGGLSFLAALVIGARLPPVAHRAASPGNGIALRDICCQPRVFVSMLVAAILMFIFSIFMTFWALWLSEDYGFGPLDLGLMGTWIAVAEFVGLLLAGLFIDRIGKRRGSLIGLMASAMVFAMVPFFRQTLWGVRAMLVLTAIVIEFALTATIPLFADQAPEARATMFSLVALGNTIGIGLGPPAATSLWTWHGLSAIVVVAALSSSLAFFLVRRFLHDLSDDVQPTLPAYR